MTETITQLRKALGEDVWGQCYVASEALYHLVGGKSSGLTPIQGEWEGTSHWALRDEFGHIIDLTVQQFYTIPDYSQFNGRGFLTKDPSKRAKTLIEKVSK